MPLLSSPPPPHPLAGPVLATVPYRPGLGTVSLATGFFGLAAAGFAHLIRTGAGGWILLPLLLASLGFVAMGLFAGIMGRLRPHRIVVYAHGLGLPVGAWWKGHTRVVLQQELHGAWVHELSGQTFATLRTVHGPVTLNRALLPDAATLAALLRVAEGGPWSLGPAAPAPPPPAAPPLPWVDRSGGRLVLKIGALAAFCGGPLRLSEALGPSLGRDPAFAVGFAPVALVLLGTFALAEERPGWGARTLRALGALGAVAVAGLGLWAWVGVARGPARPDDGLVLAGSAAGVGLAALYLWRGWGRR